VHYSARFSELLRLLGVAHPPHYYRSLTEGAYGPPGVRCAGGYLHSVLLDGGFLEAAAVAPTPTERPAYTDSETLAEDLASAAQCAEGSAHVGVTYYERWST
jgi:hypothetical protein